MRTLKFQTNPLWHQKAFTLRLSVPNAKRILVWYSNGNTKPWWLRTNRSYRFRKWTWLKAPFLFRSIANQNTPGLLMWVFTGWFNFPEKIFVPLKTNNLDLAALPNLVPGSFTILPKNKIEPKIFSVATHPGVIEIINKQPDYNRPDFTEPQIKLNLIEEPVLKTFENLNP